MPPKLKYGEGTIRKREKLRKDGTVYKYYEARYMEDGKQLYLTAKTQQECLKKLKEKTKKVKQKDCDPACNKKMTYKELLEQWMQKEQRPNLAKSSLNSIELCIRKYMNDKLKNCIVKLLKPYMLQECLNKIQSSRMRQYTYTVMSGSLRYAKNNDYIQTEIWRLVKFKKHKSVSKRPLEDKEYELLLSKADENLKRVVIAYCWTGCRKRELLTIRYEDINDNEIKVWDKKTSKWKYIPVFPPLKDIIGSGKPEDKVFNFSERTLKTHFRDLCDSLDMKDITIHSLRHTFGSFLYDAGVPMKSIQLWLGHSTLKVTEDIYTKRRKASITKDIQDLIEKMFKNLP